MISGVGFDRHLKAIGKYPLLTIERERELSNIINGEHSSQEKKRAIDELIECNTRLVVDIAKKYSSFGTLEDVVADGNVGLVIAAQRFNHKKNKAGIGKFSTFAAFYIRCYIFKGLRDRMRDGVHIPPNVFQSIPIVSKVISENPSLGNEDIAKKTKLPISMIESVKNVLEISVKHIVPLNDDFEFELPADPNQPDPSDIVHTSDLFKFVIDVAKELGYNSEEISLLSSSEDSKIVASIADRRKVTKSRIRMLKKEILWRIRRRLRDKMGQDEFELFFPGFVHHNSWRKNPISCHESVVISS